MADPAPPCFDSYFSLYFHKIVRLLATDLSISSFSKSLCLLLPPTSLLVSNLNDEQGYRSTSVPKVPNFRFPVQTIPQDGS